MNLELVVFFKYLNYVEMFESSAHRSSLSMVACSGTPNDCFSSTNIDDCFSTLGFILLNKNSDFFFPKSFLVINFT